MVRLAAALAVAAAQAASATTEPDARAMIEALRLPATAASSGAEPERHRNLAVVARVVSATETSPPGASPAAPSLSLALHFAPSSAELRPENGPLLGQLVSALLSPELRSQRFVIEGHTDARGSAAVNQRLSLERAEEVRQYLVALGVPPGRLRAVGRGAQEPANPADPAAAENRRVRVVAMP